MKRIYVYKATFHYITEVDGSEVSRTSPEEETVGANDERSAQALLPQCEGQRLQVLTIQKVKGIGSVLIERRVRGDR